METGRIFKFSSDLSAFEVPVWSLSVISDSTCPSAPKLCCLVTYE